MNIRKKESKNIKNIKKSKYQSNPIQSNQIKSKTRYKSEKSKNVLRDSYISASVYFEMRKS